MVSQSVANHWPSNRSPRRKIDALNLFWANLLNNLSLSLASITLILMRLILNVWTFAFLSGSWLFTLLSPSINFQPLYSCKSSLTSSKFCIGEFKTCWLSLRTSAFFADQSIYSSDHQALKSKRPSNFLDARIYQRKWSCCEIFCAFQIKSERLDSITNKYVYRKFVQLREALHSFSLTLHSFSLTSLQVHFIFTSILKHTVKNIFSLWIGLNEQLSTLHGRIML